MTFANTVTVAARTTIVTLVVTGLFYPLAVTGLAQALFPAQANGSLLHDASGRVLGSALIGQQFTQPGNFQPRPSSAGQKGYDGAASSGSNLGPTSQKLRDRVTAEFRRITAEQDAQGPVPGELLTASASGLDPHLSPEAATWQIARVARVRGVSPAQLARLIADLTEPRDLGFLGEPRVNVLRLNLALRDMERGAEK